MTDFDAAAPIRGIVALEALVRYVSAADPKNETDWLEWKVGLDLTSAEGRFEVAKHILGFANRDPDRARLHAGGRGFVVLGAEPGNLQGQPAMDPADIVNGLRRYIADDGPAWTPTWVSIDAVNVLVLEVEPPAWGDSIHSLRRTLGGHREGEIFVRRPGETVPRSPEELRMLERRLLGRTPQPLAVEVAAVGAGPVPLECDEQAIANWVNAERQRMLAPLADGEVRTTASKAPDDELAEAAERTLAELVGGLNVRSLFTSKPEPRSPDEYRAQVESYLAACAELLLGAAIESYTNGQPRPLVLALTNPADRPLRSVLLEVTFEGPVMSFDDDPDFEGLPSPPRKWGPIEAAPLSGMAPDFLARSNLAGLHSLRIPRVPPGFSTRNHGSTTITYGPVDLRARRTVELPGVLVVVSARAGDAIEGEWTATSTDVHGVASGTVRVELPDERLSLSELVPLRR